MNEELFAVLKEEFVQNAINNDIGKEESTKELVPNTRKNLEMILKENSHLLNEPMELKTALNEFFNKLKVGLEVTLERLDDEVANLDEKLDEDLLEELNDDIREKIRMFESAYDFAIEVQNFQVNEI